MLSAPYKHTENQKINLPAKFVLRVNRGLRNKYRKAFISIHKHIWKKHKLDKIQVNKG